MKGFVNVGTNSYIAVDEIEPILLLSSRNVDI